MERTIFHIDVNNAFLSWEAVDRLKNGHTLDIRTIPSAIAGDENTRRGIILAKSTPAKQYHVVTGEPTVKALQKCPSLLCVPPNFSLYAENSQKLFQLLSQYSDRLEVYSIDECFLDYTGMEQLFGTPLEGAEKIQSHIAAELGFTVNIGISTNKLLAKMAGELEKPNKIISLYPDEIEKKLWPLPVGELFMVGDRSEAKLQKMGIRTIGDLANFNPRLLEKTFKSQGLLFHAYANGIADSTVAFHAKNIEEAKSIGNSTTLSKDISKKEDAYPVLLSLSEMVAMRLRKAKKVSCEITVTIKSADFTVYHHQQKFDSPTNATRAIYQRAKQIFDRMWKGEPIRLLGIRSGKLEAEEALQLCFLEKDWEKEKKADAAMDTLRRKYGKDIVLRSTLMDEDTRKKDTLMQIKNNLL